MVVQDSFSILVLLKGHKMCSNRISNRFNSTQQQHIWNSTKNVCRSVSAKVMNSERKSSILQRHHSQIFCWTLKMPLVYTSRSFHSIYFTSRTKTHLSITIEHVRLRNFGNSQDIISRRAPTVLVEV